MIMLPSNDEETRSDTSLIDSNLDSEIDFLEDQVSSLKNQLSIQASTILSSHNTLSILNRIREENQSLISTEDLSSLLSTTKAQHAHNQRNLYRLCATITAFTIQDPDLNAVDKGHILALRFDVSNKGKFTRPYYVMLNKPWEGEQKSLLNVYKHTLPTGIPINSIIKKYLPYGKGVLEMGARASGGARRQHLLHFARALRHKIVAYHNRLSTFQDLRTEFGLDEKVNKGRNTEDILLDLSVTDAEIKNLRLEWIDGRIGSVVVNDEGEIKKAVVLSEGSRDRMCEATLCDGMKNLGKNIKLDFFRR